MQGYIHQGSKQKVPLIKKEEKHGSDPVQLKIVIRYFPYMELIMQDLGVQHSCICFPVLSQSVFFKVWPKIVTLNIRSILGLKLPYYYIFLVKIGALVAQWVKR